MELWKQAEVSYQKMMAPSYDFHYYHSPISKAHLEKFVSLVRSYSTNQDLVLDVGGGTGAVADRLLRMGYRRIIAVDISLPMLREAKEKLPQLTAIVCDGEHLPFKDDAFPTVMCSSVLHHLRFPRSDAERNEADGRSLWCGSRSGAEPKPFSH